MTQAEATSGQVCHPRPPTIYDLSLDSLSQLPTSINPAQSMKACTRDGSVEPLMTDDQLRVTSYNDTTTCD